MWVAGYDMNISKINCKYISNKHLKNAIYNSKKPTKAPRIRLTYDMQDLCWKIIKFYEKIFEEI